MSDGTKIEWTDATANVINGCSLESPGCTNCYAMKQAHRFPVRQGLTTKTKGGMVWTGEVRFHEPALLKVLSWQRPRMIFWNAHGDMFHPNVPDAWIDRCFAAMALTPQHIHQVLTKRSARMREYCDRKTSASGAGAVADAMAAIGGTAGQQLAFMERMADYSCLPNVWLGVSAEDQQRADERIPDLLATPAAVRWLSCEPLLGEVRLDALADGKDGYSFNALTGAYNWPEGDVDAPLPWPGSIDWIVAGGESGPGARPMHPDWARSLRDQCKAAKVPFFFKQWGEWQPFLDPFPALRTGAVYAHGRRYAGEQIRTLDGASFMRAGKKAAGRLLDGVEHNGMPGQ